MNRLFLVSIAALFLVTGTAHAQTYRGPTTADDPLYKYEKPPSALERYRPNYDPNADKWGSRQVNDPDPDADRRRARDTERLDDCVLAPNKAAEA
jgi:hypothetical protein